MKLTRRRIATANARRKTEIGTRGVRCQSALLLIIALTCLTDRRIHAASYDEIDAPPHRYRERTPKDRDRDARGAVPIRPPFDYCSHMPYRPADSRRQLR